MTKPVTITFTVTTDEYGDIHVTVQQQPQPPQGRVAAPKPTRPTRPRTYRPYKGLPTPRRKSPHIELDDEDDGDAWKRGGNGNGNRR